MSEAGALPQLGASPLGLVLFIRWPEYAFELHGVAVGLAMTGTGIVWARTLARKQRSALAR